MNKTTTHELIIRKIYRETTKSENKDLKLFTLLYPEVYNELYEFSAIKKHLDCTMLQPSKKCMANVYEYAAK